MPLDALQRQLGHRHIDTTMVYNEIRDGRLQREYRRAMEGVGGRTTNRRESWWMLLRPNLSRRTTSLSPNARHCASGHTAERCGGSRRAPGSVPASLLSLDHAPIKRFGADTGTARSLPPVRPHDARSGLHLLGLHVGADPGLEGKYAGARGGPPAQLAPLLGDEVDTGDVDALLSRRPPYSEEIHRTYHRELAEKWLEPERAREIERAFLATALAMGYMSGSSASRGKCPVNRARGNREHRSRYSDEGGPGGVQAKTGRSKRVARASMTCIQHVLAGMGYLGGEAPRPSTIPARCFTWGSTAPDIAHTLHASWRIWPRFVDWHRRP
jgi:hypothetical protein